MWPLAPWLVSSDAEHVPGLAQRVGKDLLPWVPAPQASGPVAGAQGQPGPEQPLPLLITPFTLFLEAAPERGSLLQASDQMLILTPLLVSLRLWNPKSQLHHLPSG